MHRRQVLAIAGGSIAMFSLSGCLNDDSTDDSENGTDDSENGTSEDDSDALIESADEALDEASDEFGAALDEADDPLADRSHAIETDPIEARIDGAEDDLTAARDGATDDQLETIEALEGVAEFLRDFVAVFSALGEAMDELEAWEQYVDQGRWDDAIAVAERAESYSDDALDSMTVARATFDDIDTAALEDVDEIDRVELENDLEEIEEILDVLDVFFTGSRQMTEAMIPFEEALEAFEQERFSAAASSFSSSADRFDVAYHTFSEAEDDAPSEFRSDLIDLSCEMDALGDAADYYSTGADLYAAGDYSTGDEYFEDGEAAAERCERDDIALSL